MVSRRGFLIGTGGLLTAAFVKDARSFVHRTEPLLVPPLRGHQIVDIARLRRGS